MSDVVDRANDLAEEERLGALERHRNRHQVIPRSNTGRVCVDCGERIPAKRLAAHPQASRCIEDARRYELRRKHFKPQD